MNLTTSEKTKDITLCSICSTNLLSSNYGYGMAIKEECDRAITQLYNLARGHALSRGRNYITLEDIPLIIKVVLSTASIERVTIFDLLLAYKGTMTTTQIADSLNISQPTALRTMTELKALGLVEMVNGDSNSPAKITLDSQFSWIFDKQFLELRSGFVPSDNGEYLKKECKEKYPLTSQMKIVILQKQRMKMRK